ncbi:SusC/RagA family TonB-linked outer membrane protein [Wenyingzhuangia marina]|uniref:TonB-linked outer membrane protein, SusC/RagA family n=1 Tax=Wenyingzhuangia marina TaxID=1195760 RepID=A0A1M5VYR9_9FLAO|nr:TonB-dependent receptor [Wenyingzhuangia marina]GGF77032.1 SusC/RagA family TonB-linked outer membrane protein [Wenyingzhuangia marina]SHH80338.1 TonB-linked outer membrane protein, SusC/RagA family [Wenyingzhuangia marina]
MKEITNQKYKQYKSLLTIVLIVLCSGFTHANISWNDVEQKKITGIVTDVKGQPIPGVNVIILGSQKGVITDFDGHYTILASPKDVLMFSYLGMVSKSVIVGKSTTINVVLKENENVLDEVTIIGYGSVKKDDVTGAVSAIKPNDNEALRSPSINNLIQGKVAGLDVTNTTGTPGAALSVRIRGTNSLRADNEPLYVIDGIIMNSATEDAANPFANTINDFQTQQSGLSGINPSDIETIQVLKDASATAIYGSRGANGVVLITTKKGREGKARIKASTTTTASMIGRKIDLLGADGYAEMRNGDALLENVGVRYGFYEGNIYKIKNVATGDTYFTDPESANLTTDIIDNYNLEPTDQIDWLTEMTDIAISTSNRVSVSGGTGGIYYYLATGLSTDKGIIPNSNIKSGDIRSNLSVKINDRIKIASTIYASYRTNDMNLSTDGTGNRGLMNSILNASPLNDDIFADDGEPLSNPRLWASDYYDNSKESRMVASFSTDIKLTDFLTYQFRLSGNIRNKERVRYYTDKIGLGISHGGDIGESNLVSRNYSTENLLQFNKDFSKAHSLNGTVGFTTDEYRTTTKSISGSNFSDFILGENGLNFAQTLTYNNPIESPKNYVSAFARTNYALYNKYLFTYTFRRDGVSVFSGKNKWDNFHSLALAWKLEKEKFIKNLGFVSQLKLRAGWGQTGNSSISPFQTLNLYRVDQGAGYDGATVTGLVSTGIPNPSLVWEATVQSNVGLDWSILKGRFSGAIDTYIKTTERLLLRKPIPASNGFTSTTVNVGEIENKGLEFTVDANIINNNKFSWSLGANIAFNKNKILDLGSEDTYGDGRAHFFGNGLGTGTYTDPVNIFIENEAIGMFWGLKTDGIYRTAEELVDAPLYRSAAPQLGDIRFIDSDGNGEIDNSDKQIIGNPNPDYTYGINTELAYKNLSLRLVFTGKQGNDVFNAKLGQNAYGDKLTSRNVYAESWLDRWTPDNIDGVYPRQGFGLLDAADVLVEDASYLRLSTATLNFDFPKNWLKQIGVNSASVYLTGNNLFLLTKYKGFDPEVNSFAYDGTRIGIDWSSSPRPVSYTLGVNVNF